VAACVASGHVPCSCGAGRGMLEPDSSGKVRRAALQAGRNSPARGSLLHTRLQIEFSGSCESAP
jgi:hypothetical protein